MKLGMCLISLSLAGVLLGSAGAWQFGIADEPLIQAATEYCYAGSMVDPATGEAFDLYNFCTDNLDLA